MMNNYKKLHFRLLISAIVLVLNVFSVQANENCKIVVDNQKNELVAPDGHDFHWYVNGKLIEGVESKTLKPELSGKYRVVYTNLENKVVDNAISVKVTEEGIIRIFTIGDSTVASYSTTYYPQTGWGQILGDFFDTTKISTHNRARGGRSSRSYYEEGLWADVLAELDSGDYVFIQFGHNDMSSISTRYADTTTYKEFLRAYVNESRDTAGAIPVLVSPMVQNYWGSEVDTLYNSFNTGENDYRGAMLRVAEELNVPFIDLNTTSYALIDSLGEEYVTYFLYLGLESGEYDGYYSGGASDQTHWQEMGALAMAKLITDAIAEQSDDTLLTPLANALKPRYNVSVAISDTSKGIATISGDYPEGVTITIKSRLDDNSHFDHWADSLGNVLSEDNLFTFTMEDTNYYIKGYVADCYGTIDGSATYDNCGVCTGGETGNDPCTDAIAYTDYCESTANVQLTLDDEDLYNLVMNTIGVSGAYISQKVDVATADTFLFAVSYINTTTSETLNIYVDELEEISDIALETDSVWHVAEFNLYIEAGEHDIKIETTSETGGVMFNYLALYSDNVTEVECSNTEDTQDGSFIQSDSLIVIEAEDYTELSAGSNGDNWTKALMDSSSSGSVLIAPTGTSYGASSTAQSDAPVASYSVNFPYTGSYYIWARVYAFSSSGDSYHLGLDGKVKIEKVDLYNSTNTYEEFTWMHTDQTLTVSSTGVKSLDVFCREPDLIIDKIILSQNADYSPSGYGPDESETQITGVSDIAASDMDITVYPNPADSKVYINYSVYDEGDVTISIYNTSGQKVYELPAKRQSTGRHQVIWQFGDNSTLGNGLYLIKVESVNITQVQKLFINQ